MLQHLISFIQSSKYILLFWGAFFEGPIVMISGGFFWHIGQMQFLPMYAALVFGDFSADVCWYAVGYFGARPLVYKYGKFLKLTPEMLDAVEKKFKIYHEKILVFSKLSMGFGLALAILIFSGIVRISFKKYAAINFFCGLIWVLFLIAIGYFFGNIYTAIPPSLKLAFVLAGLVIIILVLRKVKNYFAAKAL